MKISVRNLDKIPRTCRRSTLRRVHQALIPYRSKPVVFKPNVGHARCGALFNIPDVVGQRVKWHYTQQPQGCVLPKFRIVIGVDATPFWKASATRGDVYIDLGDSACSAGRPSLWSPWFTFDGSHDAHLSRHVAERQRNGIATPQRALGTRLNAKVVPAKWFQCSNEKGRNKKSSKLICCPTRHARKICCFLA